MLLLGVFEEHGMLCQCVPPEYMLSHVELLQLHMQQLPCDHSSVLTIGEFRFQMVKCPKCS